MRFLLLIPCVLLLSGCAFSQRVTPVHDRKPVLQMPARPQLEKMTPEEMVEYAKMPEASRKKLEGNNQKLQVYAAQMEVTIIEYNGYAKLSNQESNEWLGIKPVPAADGSK